MEFYSVQLHLRGLKKTKNLTSEMVKPGLFSSVMLNTAEMFLPVVHVVLKGSVAVVTVVPLAHVVGVLFLKNNKKCKSLQKHLRQTLYFNHIMVRVCRQTKRTDE